MKIIRADGETTYIRDSVICIAWTDNGKFHIDNTLDSESLGFEVDEETFWLAVAIIDPKYNLDALPAAPADAKASA